MTARLRLEDAADDALANLSDIRRSHDNLKAELEILVRLYSRLGNDTDDHISEAIALIERGVDELWCAKLAAASAVPDLDTTYRSGQRPGSYGA